MNDTIVFLKPIFQERIWGGNRLSKIFNYNLTSDKIGECWGISAHKNGDCEITNPEYSGYTLSKLFEERKDLFNNDKSKEFPLLIKILDANTSLSVQVHPDDEYALKYENDLGKNECWYVLDANEDAFVIYGHIAKTEVEFRLMIEQGKWDDLLIKKHVKKGDFINVPAGTIHALGAGLLILETQQSSDTTYRLYDYDRTDDKGNKRQLHIEESIRVSTIPHVEKQVHFDVHTIGDNTFTKLVKNEFFIVEKWDIKTSVTLNHNLYRLCSVIDGTGKINGLKIKKGDHFIITSLLNEFTLEGDFSLITSTVGSIK